MQYRRENSILLRGHSSVRRLQNYWTELVFPTGALVINYLWFMRQGISIPASGYSVHSFSLSLDVKVCTSGTDGADKRRRNTWSWF